LHFGREIHNRSLAKTLRKSTTQERPEFLRIYPYAIFPEGAPKTWRAPPMRIAG